MAVHETEFYTVSVQSVDGQDTGGIGFVIREGLRVCGMEYGIKEKGNNRKKKEKKRGEK